MPATTTSQIQTFIPQDFFPNFLAQLEVETTKNLGLLAGTMWQIIKPYIPLLIGVLFIVLVFATIKAMFGKWGTLGSVLYHVFFFALLGIIVWIKGWGIFLSAYFDIITTILYRLCYWLTGLILQRFKRPHHGF